MDYTASNGSRIMNDTLGMMWGKAVAKFYLKAYRFLVGNPAGKRLL
jgi:hypothetical protein